MPTKDTPTSTPKQKQPPAPQGMGGLDLAGLASQAAGETGARVSGQSALIDAYLNQVLGEQRAGIAADSERDDRLAQFRRSQALMSEQLDSRRMAQQTALERARMSHAAGEGEAQRTFTSEQAALERAFELGQAAINRESEDRRAAIEELQLQQLLDEQTLDPGEARAQWGQGYVGQDRGAYLSGRPVADRIRNRTFTEETGGGGFRVPGTSVRLGGSDRKTQTLTYEDLLAQAREMARQVGPLSEGFNPQEFERRLAELFRGDVTAQNLAMFDLGHLAQFGTPQG